MAHNQDVTKIQILNEEIEYYRTLIQQRPHRRRPHDCGHIRTTISFLEKRIENLAGRKEEFPFDDEAKINVVFKYK